MEAIDRIAIVIDRNARTDHADVADVVLSAGVMTAGQVDIDRRLEGHAFVAPRRDLVGTFLGMGRRKAATGLAGASNQARTERRRCGRKSQYLDGCRDSPNIRVGDTGDQQILPDRETNIAVAEIGGQLRQPADLLRPQVAELQRNADPVQTGLLLRMHADMRKAVVGRTRRNGFRRHARELAAQLLLDGREKLVKTPAIEHVLQPRLIAVGPVAVFDENAHDLVGHLGRFVRLEDHTRIARKILVAGDAAECQAKIGAGFNSKPINHLDRLKGDVVGFFQRRDAPCSIERHIELAWQAVERTVVKDVEVPFAGIAPRIENFLRIDARGRSAGDVADVVRAGATRAQAEVLQTFDNVDGVLRLDLAKLKVCARGHMRIWPAEILGEVCHAGKLPVLENAVRNPQAAHIRSLRRRDIEDAVITPAEIVLRLGRFVILCLPHQTWIGIERMLVALQFLLVVELAACGNGTVLRLEVDGVRPDRLGLCRRTGARDS